MSGLVGKRLLAVFCVLVLVMPVFSSVSASTSTSGNVVEDKVWSKLKSEKGPVEVIVTFHGDDKPTAANLELLETLGISKAVSLKSLPMVGAVVSKSQVEELSQQEEVRSVVLNEKLTYYNAESTEYTGVDRARADENFKQQNGGLPVTGKGVGVVVNDSGVDGTHQDHQFGKIWCKMCLDRRICRVSLVLCRCLM